MSQSWDEDPDFDLPPGPLPLEADDDSAGNESITEGKAVITNGHHGKTLASRQEDESDDWANEFELEPESGSAQERELEKGSIVDQALTDGDAPRTKEDEDQSSFGSAKSATLKGLLSSFSGLSLASPGGSIRSSSSVTTIGSLGDITTSAPLVPSTPRSASVASLAALSSPNKTPSAMQTIRSSSDLSLLLASTMSGAGKVHHLGSTPLGQAQSVLGDWDEDIDLEGLDLGSRKELILPGRATMMSPTSERPALRSKASFASHISDDPEDALLDAKTSLPTPRKSTKKNRPAPTSASNLNKSATSDFTDADDDDLDLESDFELPNDLAQFKLSPLLHRPSMASLDGGAATSSSASTQTLHPSTAAIMATPSAVAAAVASSPSRHSSTSPALSNSETTDDDPSEDNDEAFFEEIVLPPYFLGGPGALTPPSEGESLFSGKVNLQAVLKQKLEARGGRGLGEAGLTLRPLPDSPLSDRSHGRMDGRLDGYREGDTDDEAGEHGLVIEAGVKLGQDRVRARSSIQQPSAALKGRDRGQPSRSASASSAPGASNRGKMAFPSSKSVSSALSSTPATKSRLGTGLSRSGSAVSVTSSPVQSRAVRTNGIAVTSVKPTPDRPSSAAGAIERIPRSEKKNAGPPPAPSTARRDRIKTRTITLKSTASSGDLRGASTSASTKGKGKAEDGRLTPEVHTSSARPPLPRTLSTSTGSASTTSALNDKTLKRRTSQNNLLATPTRNRTLERKRSLQHLSTSTSSDVGPRTPAASTSTQPIRRIARTPTPGSSSLPPTPARTRLASPGPTSNFAAPTTASLRRERTASNASVDAINTTKTVPASPHRPRSDSHTTSRTSSPTSTRLFQPTAASQAKMTTSGPSNNPARSPIAGLRIPSSSMNLNRPKRARQYGDGTELDAFDDLPTSKDRERTYTLRAGNANGARKASGASSIGKRTASAESTGTIREGGNTIRGAEYLAKLKENANGGSTIKASSSVAAAAANGAGGTLTSGKVVNKRAKTFSSGSEDAAVKKAKSYGALKPTSAPKPVQGRISSTGGVVSKKASGRQEPHLIRNLGPSGASKAHGEMTWNPKLQRWEGNEGVLRDFDKVLSASTRPALITPFGNASPLRSGFTPTLPSTKFGDDHHEHQPATSSPLSSGDHFNEMANRRMSLNQQANVKVVGSMVFDPIRMSWHSIAPEGEDELDLFGFEGDLADDEGEQYGHGRELSESGLEKVQDGWERGEQERMLKTRASFVLSDAGDSENGEDGSSVNGASKAEERKAIWDESVRGAERHREEMRNWIVRRKKPAGISKAFEDDDRDELYQIRALIMDTRSPPRSR